MARTVTPASANKDSGRRTVRPAAKKSDSKSTASAARPAKNGEAARQPTEDQVRARAYEIYLARGGRDGNAESDWYQAERDLRQGLSGT